MNLIRNSEEIKIKQKTSLSWCCLVISHSTGINLNISNSHFYATSYVRKRLFINTEQIQFIYNIKKTHKIKKTKYFRNN